MHRGTDGNVIFHFKKNDFFLCHNRLSIQDLSETATQPLISEDEKFVLPLVIGGDQDASSFFSAGEVIDYEFPEPQEPEEAEEQ